MKPLGTTKYDKSEAHYNALKCPYMPIHSHIKSYIFHHVDLAGAKWNTHECASHLPAHGSKALLLPAMHRPGSCPVLCALSCVVLRLPSRIFENQPCRICGKEGFRMRHVVTICDIYIYRYVISRLSHIITLSDRISPNN